MRRRQRPDSKRFPSQAVATGPTRAGRWSLIQSGTDGNEDRGRLKMPPWIGYSRFSPSVYVSESDTDSLMERIRQLTAVEDLEPHQSSALRRRCQEERPVAEGENDARPREVTCCPGVPHPSPRKQE